MLLLSIDICQAKIAQNKKKEKASFGEKIMTQEKDRIKGKMGSNRNC